MIVAIPLAAVMIIAAIWATYLAATWEEKPRGQHARVPFADPADSADPDGEQYIAELHHEPPPLDVLTRVLGKLRELDTVPRFTPGPGCEDAAADPDVTVRLPHAHGTWGKSVTEVLDELEATYMEVKR